MNRLEVNQLVILSRRKHTDPRLRVALRRRNHRFTKNMQKRESATDRREGMARCGGRRRKKGWEGSAESTSARKGAPGPLVPMAFWRDLRPGPWRGIHHIHLRRPDGDRVHRRYFQALQQY